MPTVIYIPIWLDLLFILELKAGYHYYHLHSNMVRFIMRTASGRPHETPNLHSNMVRFIILN